MKRFVKILVSIVFIVAICVGMYYIFKAPEIERAKTKTAELSFKFLYNDGTEVADSVLKSWKITFYRKNKDSKTDEGAMLKRDSIMANSMTGNLEYSDEESTLYCGIKTEKGDSTIERTLGKIRDVVAAGTANGGYYSIMTGIAPPAPSVQPKVDEKGKEATPGYKEKRESKKEAKSEYSEDRIRSEFDSPYYEPGVIKASNIKEQEREKAVQRVLMQMRSLERNISVVGLSKRQAEVVRRYNKVLAGSDYEMDMLLKRHLRKCRSLHEVEMLVERML